MGRRTGWVPADMGRKYRFGLMLHCPPSTLTSPLSRHSQEWHLHPQLHLPPRFHLRASAPTLILILTCLESPPLPLPSPSPSPAVRAAPSASASPPSLHLHLQPRLRTTLSAATTTHYYSHISMVLIRPAPGFESWGVSLRPSPPRVLQQGPRCKDSIYIQNLHPPPSAPPKRVRWRGLLLR